MCAATSQKNARLIDILSLFKKGQVPPRGLGSVSFFISGIFFFSPFLQFPKFLWGVLELGPLDHFFLQTCSRFYVAIRASIISQRFLAAMLKHIARLMDHFCGSQGLFC